MIGSAIPQPSSSVTAPCPEMEPGYWVTYTTTNGYRRTGIVVSWQSVGIAIRPYPEAAPLFLPWHRITSICAGTHGATGIED